MVSTGLSLAEVAQNSSPPWQNPGLGGCPPGKGGMRIGSPATGGNALAAGASGADIALALNNSAMPMQGSARILIACFIELASFAGFGITLPEQEAHRETANDAVLQSVHQMTVPCYLLDVTWNVVAWNPQAAALFRGWLDVANSPNLLHFMFFHPLAKTLVSDWEERARRVVAEFRAETSHHQNTEEMRAFVRNMTHNSADFNHWWKQHDVMAREGGERAFEHPQQGALRYRQLTFHPAEHAGLKLVMLIPLPQLVTNS